jgi:hypothetical protein
MPTSNSSITVLIVVDQSLADLSARMRRSSFMALPPIKKAKMPIGDHIIVGELLEKAYALNLVADDLAEPNTLYVSPGVKALFYSDKSKLRIA